MRNINHIQDCIMPKNLSKGSTYVMPRKLEKRIVKMIGGFSFVKQILYEPLDENNQISLIVFYDPDDKSFKTDSILRVYLKVVLETRADKSLNVSLSLSGVPFNNVKLIHMDNPTTILKR